MNLRRDIQRHNQAGNFITFPDDRIVTVDEALRESGSNWRVTEQMVGYSTIPYDAEGQGHDHRWSIAPKHKALIREDTGDMLGMVGVGYGVLQNEPAFDFLRPFVESGRARIIKAGYTGQGERVVIEAVVLDADGQVQRVPVDASGRDTIENRLISYNSHDGGSSVTVGLAPYRLICINGLMVLVPEYSAIMKMRHTSTLEKRVKRFQEFLLKADASFGNLMETYRVMAKTRMSLQDFEVYAKQTLGWNEKKAEESKLEEPRAMNTLRRLFQNGRGQELPTGNGTLFGAFNAFTEWVEHERGQDENRYEASNFGAGAQVRNVAFKNALSLIEA